MAERKHPELLSPAGSPEALRAAVQYGADAVYLGCGAFNARRGAKNFSTEEFAQAVAYCHLRGVKVYLTLNTLVTDRELPGALETARMASRLGVDAILVQDWGLFALLRAALPDQPLHASTQMSLFTSGGAREAAAMGCERVVVARELSKNDIAAICQNCPVEVETFAHGALCMCYSGQCAMSAVLGGRSGNRGTCAQPCRLPYGVNSAAKNQFPLSLKDSSLAGQLGEMADLGVACLKLEGRMKRPEYVAVITEIYARLLREDRRPTAAENALLEAAFSRSGFTQGYWTGKPGPDMFGVRSEHAAEPKELFAEKKAGYEKGDLRTDPDRLSFRVATGDACTLTATDGDGHSCTVTGPVPEAARSRSLTAEEVEARLAKTGGTAFACEQVHAVVDDGLSLPASAVNALRRDALAALEAARTAPPPRRETVVPALLQPENDGAWPHDPALTVSLFQPEQLTPALLAARPSRVYLPLERLDRFDWQAHTEDTEFWAILPRVWRDGDEALFRRWLDQAKADGLSGVLLGNLGHFPLVRDLGLPMAGDYGLNLFNSPALLWAKDRGLVSATANFELRREQLRDLRKPLATEALVYGRLPLQITENCPTGNAGGCHGEQRLCDRENYLQDRTGVRFPLLPAFGCRCEVQNSRPLYLADRQDWKTLGLRYARLRFTDESPFQCAAVLRAYQEGVSDTPELFTRGLFDKGVD